MARSVRGDEFPRSRRRTIARATCEHARYSGSPTIWIDVGAGEPPRGPCSPWAIGCPTGCERSRSTKARPAARSAAPAPRKTAAAKKAVAKAKAGLATNLAVREGVQMHGGIGMTDEYDIGLYMKRDRALAEFMGDVHYHTEQVARMSGY